MPTSGQSGQPTWLCKRLCFSSSRPASKRLQHYAYVQCSQDNIKLHDTWFQLCWPDIRRDRARQVHTSHTPRRRAPPTHVFGPIPRWSRSRDTCAQKTHHAVARTLFALRFSSRSGGSFRLGRSNAIHDAVGGDMHTQSTSVFPTHPQHTSKGLINTCGRLYYRRTLVDLSGGATWHSDTPTYGRARCPRARGGP